MRSQAERKMIIEWLEHGGFQPVPLGGLPRAARELEAAGFEVLLADAGFAPAATLAQLARVRGPHPLVVIGDVDPGVEADIERRGATYLIRPLDRTSLLFSLTLAIAEGRPMRRSPRKMVANFSATVDGVQSRLLDISYEGIRLEIAARHRATLPPVFTVEVPVFNVKVAVQRVWVSTPVGAVKPGTSLWCGGSVYGRQPASARSWRSFVDTAPVVLGDPRRMSYL